MKKKLVRKTTLKKNARWHCTMLNAQARVQICVVHLVAKFLRKGVIKYREKKANAESKKRKKSFAL